MTEKMRIGFDCDDVLVNSADYTARLYNDAYGTSLTRDHWYDFGSMEPWGVDTFAQAATRVTDIMHADTYTGLEALPDASRVLRTLKLGGHALMIVTGRPDSLRASTERMLEALYPAIFDSENLYFTNHFGTDGTKLTKASVATRLGLTHFVDDQIEHANGVAATGIQTILFSDRYAWNREGADANVTRVGGWPELGEYFDGQR